MKKICCDIPKGQGGCGCLLAKLIGRAHGEPVCIMQDSTSLNVHLILDLFFWPHILSPAPTNNPYPMKLGLKIYCKSYVTAEEYSIHKEK